MDKERIVSSTQEQASSAWVGWLNQIRLNELFEKLSTQNGNLAEAMASMDDAMKSINNLIITNRGGGRGIHGFIAEVAETGLENAKSHLHGGPDVCEWINDNGAVDLRRGNTPIQMKFVQSEYSLKAVSTHLKLYSDFISKNGVYQIPKDYYDTVKRLYGMSQQEASRLTRNGDGPSYSDWKMVQEFFASSNVDINDLEPSEFEYAQVQKNAIGKTMADKRVELQHEDERIRERAYRESRPTFSEGAKASAVAAALEGASTFALSVKRRLSADRHIGDITQKEWIEIAEESGMGLVKGGVRGGATYFMNNFTATPAAVASAMVTASFGMADRAYRFRSGRIDEMVFIEESEMVCLDAAVSAAAGFAGQTLIPIPVVGALVGNIVGTTAYELGKDVLRRNEQSLLSRYAEEQEALAAELADEYTECITHLNRGMARYIDVLGRAFSPDIDVAFMGSVELATFVGVPGREILKNKNDVDDFFLS